VAAFPDKMFQLVGGRLLPVSLPVSPFGIAGIWGTSDITYVVRNSGAFTTTMIALGGRLFRPAAAETVCDDFWDDDDDGLTDCADPDCTASPACAGLGACAPATVVTCGQTVSGTTVGGSSKWPFYGAGCVDRPETGREAHFVVRRATAGSIQLSLDATGTPAANLDLIVPGRTAGGACTPAQSCVASAQTSADPEVTSFAAAANTDYAVIVDGYAGATDTFQLTVTCP